MTKWVLLFLLACGPGLKPMPVTPDELTGDAPTLRRLMHDSVFNGGLAFDDPACAKDFGAAGEVKGEKLDAFAACLAALHLAPSARKDRLPDVLVMQYAPGYEVQARVTNEDGGTLRWIGFASRVEGDLDVPTITHDTFEKLRLGGDPKAAPPPDVASQLELDPTSPETRAAVSWFKVCLDASGAIVKLDPFVTTSPRATKAFVGALASWKFRPFVTRGAPIPVCSMVRLAYPPDQAPPDETLPLPPPPSRSKVRPIVLPISKLIESKRIAGEKQIFPNDVDKAALQDSRRTEVRGTFRICLDEAGVVESVLPIELTRLGTYDQKIMATMHDWRYSPYEVDGVAVPVCTYVTFIYSQRGGPVRVIR